MGVGSLEKEIDDKQKRRRGLGLEGVKIFGVFWKMRMVSSKT